MLVSGGRRGGDGVPHQLLPFFQDCHFSSAFQDCLFSLAFPTLSISKTSEIEENVNFAYNFDLYMQLLPAGEET